MVGNLTFPGNLDLLPGGHRSRNDDQSGKNLDQLPPEVVLQGETGILKIDTGADAANSVQTCGRQAEIYDGWEEDNCDNE